MSDYLVKRAPTQCTKQTYAASCRVCGHDWVEMAPTDIEELGMPSLAEGSERRCEFYADADNYEVS
jgi:hypothetical protein